ncbi:recombinase RarA [Thermosipho melanesiensis]|uniref:AAA ATPase, central domain protein n=2 Tax=Thermosipho melanesiensis TaxID=46541 RepID=A6LJD0_THEM4|nr:replication-associated recombination protein A [Thermosipho melanesiensis]ABR30031.1 AAA ATPase, central domain protein [Thermosipho melanesiensis BI429]APT73232.1 recombinase RarA [Thermosipho melanesiensis]OOC38625.1 recombinase RarA [Thermosipho melanesiensis]OOC40429.1 recombinase RarA [Thermosipho melanesiensis]OOC40694.1 recombinase RarA [Thermosipho melanesiensis]
MSGLSEILRPKGFEEFIGQEHLFGEKGLIRLAIESGNLFSAVFYGPPGCGKTSTLEIIRKKTDFEIYHFNAAVTSTIDVKKVLDYAQKVKGLKKMLIFVDEIHRFNKKQQDIFLPGIERGDYIFIGATTENPFKMINPALLSRIKVIAFKKLKVFEIKKLLERAISVKNIDVMESVMDFITRISDGDARFAINIYDVLSDMAKALGKEIVDDEIVTLYGGEVKMVYTSKEHYELASAFIKSIRGSDPDAALYYMARMLEVGEDPRFIARRLAILASEDVGLADPMAILIAIATAQAVELVGLPECVLNLSECVIYLSLAPKSNSSTLAISKAIESARETMNLSVPFNLLNVKDSGYKNPHHYGGFLKKSYLPKGISDKVFYIPKEIGKEKRLKEILEKLWEGVKEYGNKD